MHKLAIITRTKDRSLLLKRALQSVGSQTYRDYIHVIVNDGGDRSAVDRLIDRLPSEQRGKTKLFHREESSGAPDTIFNESIDRIESEYFAIHDDDDTWDPEFLSHTVSHLDNHTDLGAVVVRADKVIEAIDGDVIRTRKTTRWMPDMSTISLYRQCIDNHFTPIATLFRRSAYERVGKFDDTLPVVGDWEFGVRLLMEYEADFIDPGFSLAFYHHRQTKDDNSFAKHNHRKYVTLVANKYLRDELRSGRLGVGYIMSELKYRQGIRHGFIKKLMPNRLVKVARKKL